MKSILQFAQRILSATFFAEASPMIQTAKTSYLEAEDTPPLPEFLRHQDQEPIDLSTNWRFVVSVFSPSKWWMISGYAFNVSSGVAGLLLPFALKDFIESLFASPSIWTAFGNALWMGLLALIFGLGTQHFYYRSLVNFKRVANRLTQFLVKKTLNLHFQERQRANVGDLINLMSSDVDAVGDLGPLVGDLLWAVLVVLGFSGILVFQLGIWSLVPLGVLFCIVPLSQVISKRLIHSRNTMQEERDRRLTLVSQVFSFVRLVKAFVWEAGLTTAVEKIRNRELDARRGAVNTEVWSILFYQLIVVIAFVSHLWVMRHLGESVSLALFISYLALYGTIEEPLGKLSFVVSNIASGWVSIKRLRDFGLRQNKISTVEALAEPELDLRFNGASLAYHKNLEPSLKKVNFSLDTGQSLAIVGEVGSGKSSLLLSLLGELEVTEGSVAVQAAARFGYVPQEAFLLSGTLLQNLSPANSAVAPEFVARAIQICSLEKDLKLWPDGLKTEIGEKGVNLSGGQKTRVNLARVFLLKPDILLLDDPLAAVDVETEQRLVDHLIFGEWKDRTRLVVTHRLQHLRRFDRILVLKGGEQQGFGTYDEVSQSCKYFQELMAFSDSDHSNMKLSEIATKAASSGTLKLLEEEERFRGAVGVSTYKKYFRGLSGLSEHRMRGVIRGLLLVGGSLSVVGIPLLQKLWVTSQVQNQDQSQAWLGTFALWSIVGVVATAVNLRYWFRRGLAVSEKTHRTMLESLFRAPIAFFDGTPVGRILQRFSRDLEVIDVHLQWNIDSFVHCLLYVAITLLLIVTSSPWMLAVILPMIAIYNRYQSSYRRPAREIKRLDSLARSPRYSFFKESVIGLIHLRNMGLSSWIWQESWDRLMHSQRMFRAHVLVNRWFSTRMPLLGAALTLISAFGFFLFVKWGWVQPALASVTLFYVSSLGGYLNWGIRAFADIESKMISIERLDFYSHIAPEPGVWQGVLAAEKVTLLGQTLDSDNLGVVLEFKNVWARYSPEMPHVLKDLSFALKRGEKLALIGRTGAGKSSVLQCLFRFLDFEKGEIRVHGHPLRDIPLDVLRGSFSFVPQDPVLFIGDLRDNLDRFGEYKDEDIFEALRKVRLMERIQVLPGGLSHPVTENGGNFSQGERQLLCMARAILRRSALVVLDEATASIDVATDALIQFVIRQEMADQAVITIAHRLSTVADYDQILEMSAGEVVRDRAKTRMKKKMELIEEADTV